MSAERALTVPLPVEACVSAVELSAGSGSGSFRAASVEVVAFLAERLCFTNLALSFLEVLILARRSNKEPSEYTVYLGQPMKQRTVSAARRLSEFWMVATLSVSSRRCAGRGTAICCAELRASEQRAGGGPPRRPEKAAWDRYIG